MAIDALFGPINQDETQILIEALELMSIDHGDHKSLRIKTELLANLRAHLKVVTP